MAINRDLYNSIGLSVSLDCAVYTADQNGTGVDILGHDAVVACFGFGATGDTLSASINVLPVLQESDASGSGFTDVAAADMLGALTLVDDNTKDSIIQKVGYIGSKRYLRTKYDFTGTHTNGIECFGFIIRGNASLQPVS